MAVCEICIRGRAVIKIYFPFFRPLSDSIRPFECSSSARTSTLHTYVGLFVRSFECLPVGSSVRPSVLPVRPSAFLLTFQLLTVRPSVSHVSIHYSVHWSAFMSVDLETYYTYTALHVLYASHSAKSSLYKS